MAHSGGGNLSLGCPYMLVVKASLKLTQQPKKGQEACHVFKFVCRESLDPNIEVHNAFSGIEESPRDVVLLAKPFMGSEELAQVPKVCFPFVGLNY